MIKVIKEKETVMRDRVEWHNFLIMHGLKKDFVPNKNVSKREIKEKTEELIQQIQGDWSKETEEVHRLRGYEEGKIRSVKIKFSTMAQLRMY